MKTRIILIVLALGCLLPFISNTTIQAANGGEHEPPLFVVDYPANDSLIYVNSLTVRGVVNDDCILKINGNIVTIKPDKTFSQEVSLSEGNNGIIMEAEDSAGKKQIVTLKTTYVKQPDRQNGNIVVYINWDGFAKYYVDLAEKQGKIPTLSQIKNHDGVFFTNAYTGIPSISNPMQAAIASGTTSRFTDNHYRYFNKKLNRVIQEHPATKDEAETLAAAAVRQNLNVLSINQFAFRNRGTVSNDPAKAYVIAPAGVNGYSDGIARFDAAIRLIKTLKAGGMSLKQIPSLIALYMDDLDGIGHNEETTYGIARVKSEEARKQSVVNRLAMMDQKLGELIQACKDAGLYNNMSFVLTTDHGMAPFGLQQSANDVGSQTKLPELVAAIESLGPGYHCQILQPGRTWVPSPGTDIAIVTVGLQVQLSYVGQFDPVVIHLKNQKIAELLKNKVYVDQIMFPDEMASRGLKPGFADLIISPKPPYHFHLPNTKLKVARGQHDSLAEEAQHIAAFMWGKDIKKGFLCTDIIHNYDFTPTMARLLGINAPLDATGKVLYTVFEDISPSQDYTVQFDDEEAIASENTEKIWDEEASGRTVTSLYNRSAWLEFDNLPAAEKIVVKYAAADDGKLSLYVNNQFVRDIFFPAIDEGIGKYDYKRINLALNKGDTLRLVNESSHDAGIWIDNIVLFTNDKNEAVTENGGTDFLLNPQ